MNWRARIIGGGLLVTGFGLLAYLLATVGQRGDDLGVVDAGFVSRPAPALALPSLSGEDVVDLSAMIADGPVVVNFWASWCAPCRVEHPILMRLEREGVRVLGVAYRDEPEDSRRFLSALGDPFVMIAKDGKGQAGLDWGVTGVPESFLVTPDGTIAAHFRGPLTPEGARPFLDLVAAAHGPQAR